MKAIPVNKNLIKAFATALGFDIPDCPDFTEFTSIKLKVDISQATPDDGTIGYHGKIVYSIASGEVHSVIAVSECDCDIETFRFSYIGKMILKSTITEILDRKWAYTPVIDA